MNVLIAGGGTGGHLFPAIAVAEEFVGSHPETKVTFIGTAMGLESRIIPLTMWELLLMKAPRFKGTGLFSKLIAVLSLPLVFCRAWAALRLADPDIVISVGGYAAGPVTLVAALKGIPTVAMEQNAIPGMTNRLLRHFVKKVFVTFADSVKYFPLKKTMLTGNPVRKKIKEASIHKPVKHGGFTILVFGGSQGARKINEKLIEALSFMDEVREDIHIIHQIGRAEDADRIAAAYKARGFSAEVYHFIEDMGKIYSLADMVVCRAGATSIAELAVTGKPAILIPYPFAADNHQVANANALVNEGAAIMILDRDLTGEALAAAIKGLLEEPLNLASMSGAMKEFGRPDAAGIIVRECLKICRRA